MCDCGRFLTQLLQNNTSVTVPPAEQSTALRALARQVWQAGLLRAPVAEIAVREAEDERVTDIAAVLVVVKENVVIESGVKRRAVEVLCLIIKLRPTFVSAPT